MKVVSNFAVVRGDNNELHTLADVFEVSEERGKELLELGAVSEVADEDTAEEPKKASSDGDTHVTRRGPGRPRKHS